MKKNHKRISAAVLSLALGFTIAGAPMLAPVASAQSVPVTINAGQASTVNLNTPITLNINKFDGEVGDTSTPLGEVQFRIQKLQTAPLNTLAGWQNVADAQTELQTNGVTGLTLDASYDQTVETDDITGSVSITTGAPTSTHENFTVGAYLVTEIAHDNFSVADPFIVTLPHAAGDSWNYTQEVNPKNQVVSVDKNVDDEGVALGQDIEYTISASIPAQSLTRLVIEDRLPTELGPANLASLVVSTTGDPLEAALTAGDDYTVVNNANNDSGPVANDLVIELTSDGLAKLNTLRATAGNADLKLQVVFEAQVVALPGDGAITNDVIVTYPNQTINTGTTPDPDDGAETRLGQLTVNKVDTDDQPIIGDATFQLWRCSLVGSAWTVEGTALPVITDPNVTTEAERAAYAAASPGGVMPTSFTTAPTGTATIYGVQAFNFENGADTTESNICLVETEAPAGYNLNPQPVPVTEYDIDPDDPNRDTAAEVDYAMVSDFENLKNDELVNLPETGGYGTMALIGAGVLVAAAGGAAAVRGNRARNN